MVPLNSIYRSVLIVIVNAMWRARQEGLVKFIYKNWTVLILLVLWIGFFSKTDYMAKVYGFVNPAVSMLRIESVTPFSIDELSGAKISGTATKRRNCDYIGITWRLREDDGTTPVRSYFLDKPQVRLGGVQRWEALIVGVPPDRIEETFAMVRHRCLGFPVISKFY